MPPRRSSQAFSAISPPIPAGSPIVTASGSATGLEPDIDKGGAPQVSHVTPRQSIEALAHQGFRDRLACRHWRRRARYRFLAHHDDPDTVFLHDRLRSLPGFQPEHETAHGRGDLVRSKATLARQLWRTFFLADLEQVLAIFSGGLRTLRLCDRSAARGVVCLRRKREDDLDEVQQTVFRAAGITGAPVEDEEQIVTARGSDRRR